MAGRGHAYRAPARPPRFSLVAAPERTPQLGVAATGAPRRNIAAPLQQPRNTAAPPAAPTARAQRTRQRRDLEAALVARRQRALSDSRRTASEMRSFMAALDRVERMGPSLHRLPANELLAIQATLRGGVPAPGGEGFLLPPIAAAPTPSATEAAAAPPPPPGLTAAQHATLPCHVCERAPGYHCAICLGDVEAGHRVCTLSCAHAFHEGCVREWLRRAQVCPLCKTHACGEGAPG